MATSHSLVYTLHQRYLVAQQQSFRGRDDPVVP
jgi:hypothetical protein